MAQLVLLVLLLRLRDPLGLPDQLALLDQPAQQVLTERLALLDQQGHKVAQAPLDRREVMELQGQPDRLELQAQLVLLATLLQ